MYNDSAYGRYIAMIQYPAKYNRFLAPKDISGALYPGVVVANGFAGSYVQIQVISNFI